jgi:AcrR family transcriptional regulator
MIIQTPGARRAPTKSEKTIASILSSAEALFLAKNYADVTMGGVAQRCGVTKGALYHHFPSKEDLYLQMMHAALARKRALFGRALASGRDCRERLGNLTRAFFDLPKDEIGLMRLVRRDVNIFAPTVRAKLVRSYQASLPSLVEAIIRDGIRDGELAPADPRLLAWHFVATVEVTLGRHADSVFKDPRAKMNHVLDIFFRGAAAARRARQGALS